MICYYDDIEVGHKESFSKTISECDVYTFAGITGDFNPVHINAVEAEKSVFKGRVAHGCLIDSFISTVLGMKYPGEGTIFMEKSVKYVAPVRIGDTVTTTVEVEEIQPRGRVLFKCVCTNQDGKEVVTGHALVIAPAKL